MKCIICGRTIKPKEPHTHTSVYHGDKHRKVYGCTDCSPLGSKEQTTFDDWLDALPVDSDGRPIDPRVK